MTRPSIGSIAAGIIETILDDTRERRTVAHPRARRRS
jgi:hypothetical protein